MPTYEYACPQGHEFELFQKMSDKPRAKCPVCGRLAVRKISGGAGLHFKGSGFYITDYGKDGKGPRNDKAHEATDSSKPGPAVPATAEAAAKPDSKPAAGAPKAADKPAKAEKPAKKAKS
jgi:putative FmdB family regulatory protein